MEKQTLHNLVDLQLGQDLLIWVVVEVVEIIHHQIMELMEVQES